MKKALKNLILSTIVGSSFLLSAVPSFAKEETKENISEYLLEPMPGWYRERYTQGHLDIARMMKNGYTRLEAIEIQNQMKDILDADAVYTQLEDKGNTYDMFIKKDQFIVQALEMAIKRVKQDKYFESGFKPEALKDNEFYVVFDLDETLLVQWYESGLKGSKYYDIKVSDIDNILRPLLTSPDYVSFIPGFEKSLKEISKIPGNKGIIFFSAKLDTATLAIINKMTIDGKPIKSFIKGLFTRNHLVQESEPAKLAKDLRMIDESLKHVILIDDNPTRILENQKKNLREFPKYNPDEYLKSKNESKDKVISNYFEKLLPVVIDEIKETEEYSRKNNMSFTEAFYPYSTDASTEIIMLQKQGYTMKDSINFIRKNKKVFEPKFFFYEEKK